MLRTGPYTYADDLIVLAPAPTRLRASRGSNQTTKRRHTQDEELLGELATGTTGRASRAQYQQRRSSLRPVPNTHDDEQVAPSTRSGRMPPQYRQPYPVKQGKHFTFHIGVGILIALLFILLYCFVGTVGKSWFETHFTDPGTYGPAHGQVLHGVFGGGDSQEKSSKVMSINSDGHVFIVKITANDPSKAVIIPGPDLAKIGFPDPTGANVEIKVTDVDLDGNQDVKVTVVATVCDSPFHRYSRDYTLYGDGQGNLKQRDPQQAQEG